jgi:hypothetical protein
MPGASAVSLVILAALLQWTAIAAAQQTQQIGTGSSAANTSSSTLSNAVNPSLSRPILLPNGARRTASPSTVIVCDFDDLSGTYFDAADVCSLGR